jgi:hypothetical protein
MKRTALLSLIALLAGCVTTGYSYVKDPNTNARENATITDIEAQNIYNSVGASLVGGLAPVEAVGWSVDVITDSGKKMHFVIPQDKRYTFKAGDHVTVFEKDSRVWIEPQAGPLTIPPPPTKP